MSEEIHQQQPTAIKQANKVLNDIPNRTKLVSVTLVTVKPALPAKSLKSTAKVQVGLTSSGNDGGVPHTINIHYSSGCSANTNTHILDALIRGESQCHSVTNVNPCRVRVTGRDADAG